MFGHKYRYLFIFLLATYSWMNTHFMKVYDFYGIEAPELMVYLTFVLLSAFTWEANRLLETRGLRPKTILKFSLNPIARQFFYSLPIVGIGSTALLLGLSMGLLNKSFEEFQLLFLLGITYSFRINLFLHIINLVFSLFDQFKKKELETERLKKAQLEQEVQLLKEQMNPHFLFNNLNVLSALLLKEDKDANLFLEKFAEVYRYVLQVQKTDLISLKEELQLLDAYLYLLQHRFPEALKVEISIAPSLQHSRIVPMTLQILLENVVKHNQVHASNPIQVRITAEDDKIIKIANKIKPKAVDNISANGIGLKSIEKRYKLVSTKPIGIRHDDDEFEVELPVIF